MATRIKLVLKRGTYLTEEEATDLLHELAQTLGFTVVNEESAQDDQIDEWLTRAQFDQKMTEYVDASYVHRTWHDLCSYRGWRVLRVKCGTCGAILLADNDEQDDHFFIGTDSCGGQYAAHCSIGVASFIRAYDEGVLISSRLGTKGKKTALAVRSLVEQLRQARIE